MNTKHIGNIGESAIIAEFVFYSIPIYIPFGDNESCDIIAEFEGKLQKVQIKTSSKISNNKIEFKLNSRRYGYDHKYSTDEVDYFALYCIQNRQAYLVKNGSDFNTRSISLRLNMPANNRVNINLAEDFTFKNVLNK